METRDAIKNTSKKELKVNGHTITLSHQDKIYWPKEKYTKGDVLNYYDSVYKYIIPYLKDRPQSLRRNPNGITDEGFFHKDLSDQAPDWVKTKTLYSESAEKDIGYIICNDKATLFYMNNLGCIELNPWNSRLDSLDNPDYLVIDIDPSEKNTFNQVIEVAQAVKEVLNKAKIEGYCKTSGATGLHVYVPLSAQYDYTEARVFAEIIARHTNDLLPEITTIERALNKRKGRIYIDYLQNKRGQTLASVYSLRPKPGATVSTPLDWKEVKKGLEPIQFNIKNVAARVSKKGDLFKPVLGKGVNLKNALKLLDK